MNMLDWMHDDITWCLSECDDVKCCRNLKNKRIKTGLFSAAMLKYTEYCPSYDEEKQPKEVTHNEEELF